VETKISVLDDDSFDSWDAYLSTSDSSTLFQGSAWMHVVKETYGHQPLYLQATRGDQIVGVLPLFLVTIPLMGRIIASDPFTSYGGICADDSAVACRLLEAAAELAKSHDALYVEIKNLTELRNHSEGWCKKEIYCTMLLDLSEGADAVWTSWKGKTRTDVRRAIKMDVKLSKGHHDLLDPFYSLVTADMKRLGTPVHSRAFYRNILNSYPNDARIYLATKNGAPIASILTIRAKQMVQAYASASDWEARNIKPTSLLYWQLIKDAVDMGVKTLDFGRSTLDSGTYKFKQGMGGIPVPLNYYYWLHRSKSIPNVHQENNKLLIATRAWSWLPLPITRWLGPKLIRYVV